MSNSRGAGIPPITYAGEWNNADTYHPLKIVKHSDTAYLSVARNAGVIPGTDSSTWMKLGGGGPVLWVSTAAGGPPTDGSVFWFVTDETC